MSASGWRRGAIGPDGTNWLQVPREQILASPDIMLRPLEIPDGLERLDRELVREQLEAKRNNLEEFRAWAEQTQRPLGSGGNYQKSLEIYKTRIGQYRDALSSLK